MNEARRIRLAEVAPQPWKNGGGTTRELLAWPSAADWRVRLSVADITRDGPFSAYDGVERWFAVVDGAGVVLELPGEEVALTRHSAPLCFDGAAAPGCRLVDGPTRDLNLMLRGARGTLVPVDDGVAWEPDAAMAGLFSTVAGRCSVDDRVFDVAAGMLLWFETAPRTLRFDAGTPPAGAWWIAATPGEAPA